MATRRSKTPPVPYQAHRCAMPGCDRPAHMYCSDGQYYCCVSCQMAPPGVVAPHASHCDAYVAKHKEEEPMATGMHDGVVSYDTAAPLITQVEYQAFQDAYDFFNAALFGARLPQVLVTLQRRAYSKGYFAPERFDGRLATVAVRVPTGRPTGLPVDFFAMLATLPLSPQLRL